ncbi:MAG: AhpC/TSA family protein [Alistipes sp.]|jgi:peroxiredoxin|nr:AhpC/TSA family protein [Alistipes sp.]
MKRSFILLAAGLLAACGPRPGATLEATVTGMADGTKVYLFDSAQNGLDTTVVAGGKFRFDIPTAYPDQNALLFEGQPGLVPFFFVEPGTIRATIDPAVGAEFSGTPTNDAYKTYDEDLVAVNNKKIELEAKFRITGWKGTPEIDSLLRIYEAVDAEYWDFPQTTALKNPNTILAAYLINRYAHTLTSPEMVDSALTIVAGAPENAFTDRLRERREMLTLTAVGVEAPDFTQARPDGTPLSLSSLRGKLVLIDFWASWCVPCRVENPNVVKLYERFKDKGFEILGVSLDSDREAWLKAIEDDGLTWRHVSDLKDWQNAVAVQYAVRSIPHTVLVGPDGVIIAKNLRGAALETKVAEILD